MVPNLYKKIEDRIHRRVLVLSLPLHVNYGGVLQSFALIKTLDKLEYDVQLVQCVPTNEKFAGRMIAVAKFLINRFLFIFPAIRKSYYLDFKKKYIPLRPILFNYQLNKINKEGVYAVIVGSDQVWNNYTPKRIYNYFLSFIYNSSIIKLSYAASFGKDEFPGDDETRKICSRLIQTFKSVSVREESGVDICRKQLNRSDAKHVLDPTLLLTKDDYDCLLADLSDIIKSKYNNRDYLYSYLLGDDISDNKKFVEKICVALNIECEDVLPVKSVRKLLLRKHVNISIEEWLYSIRESSYVICNSFHACVFSIIYHKNFIVLPCHGMNRISELLKMCEIDNRIVDSYDIGTVLDLFRISVNWDRTDEIIKQQKQHSINFITNSFK